MTDSQTQQDPATAGRTYAAARRGVESAIVASVPQVLVPKLEEWLLLRGGESADLGPRFIEALARKAGRRLPEDVKWLSASAFHFGYASVWGLLYAFTAERWPRLPPWVGGLALAGVIHLITFPPWGGAVVSGAEPPPTGRSWRKEVVLLTAPLVFGLGTALLYAHAPRVCEER
jgi:hypothetical protein